MVRTQSLISHFQRSCTVFARAPLFQRCAYQFHKTNVWNVFLNAHCWRHAWRSKIGCGYCTESVRVTLRKRAREPQKLSVNVFSSPGIVSLL